MVYRKHYFENNTAATAGGGLYHNAVWGTLYNLTFVNNSAHMGGGAHLSYDYYRVTDMNYAYTTLSDSRFINNHAIYGGGALNTISHVNVDNCEFIDNSANNYGGALSIGFSNITNSRFINNTAPYGGAVFSYASGVTDSNFTDNNANFGNSVYVVTKSYLNNNSGDDDAFSKPAIDGGQITGSHDVEHMLETEAGYYGFCSELYNFNPYTGVYDDTMDFIKNSINGEPVSTATRSGGRRVTETTINASNHFELGYHDNSFTIQLSTLTYENPEHIVYLYSINGEPFRALPAGSNELSFTHLPPGTYRFRVKAERSGIETPQRDFTVIVRSPWYRSAWAYFFYALVIGLFAWQFLAYRHHREQNRLRLQAHIHAEEMSEAKLRFFMNISHDIRTPMTLILTPLLSLIKKEDDPERKSVYETIRRNAERILSLINQMMDLRKIDKGQMQMRMSERNLVGFINDIYTLFDHQAKTRQDQVHLRPRLRGAARMDRPFELRQGRCQRALQRLQIHPCRR